MMDKSTKKKGLLLFLDAAKGDKKKRSDDYDSEEDDLEDDEKYESFGEDLLEAINLKDAKKVGQAIADIVEACK